MIRAICFNKRALTDEGFMELLDRMGAEDGGTITFTFPPNCVESFPDGTLCRSNADREYMKVSRTIVYCGDDQEKFIYVNSYGPGAKPSYDDLVQMLQDGEISMVDFIEAQEDLSGDYHKWLRSRGLDRTQENAGQFLDETEQQLTVLPPLTDYFKEDNIILMLN